MTKSQVGRSPRFARPKLAGSLGPRRAHVSQGLAMPQGHHPVLKHSLSGADLPRADGAPREEIQENWPPRTPRLSSGSRATRTDLKIGRRFSYPTPPTPSHSAAETLPPGAQFARDLVPHAANRSPNANAKVGELGTLNPIHGGQCRRPRLERCGEGGAWWAATSVVVASLSFEGMAPLCSSD
ncbi:hypothetical protein NL676_011846 [Syzygium grande]|nr:hypothetical protein NL676_011846 [Syzygium grande]